MSSTHASLSLIYLLKKYYYNFLTLKCRWQFTVVFFFFFFSFFDGILLSYLIDYTSHSFEQKEKYSSYINKNKEQDIYDNSYQTKY